MNSGSGQISFGKYYWSVFFRPAGTFHKLLQDPRQLRFGFIATAINAFLYTLVYLFLILGEGRPYKPWLNIPPEVYYRYNVFFLAPSMLLGWVLAAGVVQLCCRSFTKEGNFDSLLSVFGFGISIASWATMVHDLSTSFLGGMHIISQADYEVAMNSPTIWRTLLWIQMVLYLLWFVLLFTLGVRMVYKLRWLPAALLGILAFVIYQGFFFIFNR